MDNLKILVDCFHKDDVVFSSNCFSKTSKKFGLLQIRVYAKQKSRKLSFINLRVVLKVDLTIRDL